MYTYYGIIYKITNKINNKIYIGQTISSMNHRWHQHKTSAKIDLDKKTRINSAIRKYTSESFIIETIDYGFDRWDLNNLESFYIKKYNSIENGYNVSEGAYYGLSGEKNPFYGVPRTEEVKKKISKANFGKNNGMYGKTSIKKGKTLEEFYGLNKAEEIKAKISAKVAGNNHPNYQKPLTEEVKRKISNSHKGKKLSPEHIKKISKPIICLNNKKEYSSSREACKELGLQPGNVAKVLKGGFKHTKKYIFIYKEVDKI
jgi:group I intron endonuclease